MFGVDSLNMYMVGLCIHVSNVATTIVKGGTFLDVLLRLFRGFMHCFSDNTHAYDKRI